MSPLEIEVLLHCYSCPAPHPRAHAPAVAMATERFRDNGLIEECPRCGSDIYYQTTDRGKVLVRILCSTPFPVQKWVDQNNNIIEI